MLKTTSLLILCALAVLMPAAVWAGERESLQRIAEAAVQALDIGQGGDAVVDPGLKLDRCGQPLIARVVSSGTVEVACPSLGWKVFVPVRVRNSRDAVVLRRPLQPGQAIVSDDLVQEPRDLGRQVSGVITDLSQAVGRVARRSLQVGSLLTVADLQAEMRIRRGETVDLVARRGTVEIRVSARATKDAAVGDVLVVENLSNRRPVQGIVAEDGTVQVK